MHPPSKLQFLVGMCIFVYEGYLSALFLYATPHFLFNLLILKRYDYTHCPLH
jgi:hypothetical protein